MKISFLFLLLFFGFVSPVLAYIDPGTGMAFISGIGAWIAALFIFMFGAISLTFKKWTGWLKKIFSRFKK